MAKRKHNLYASRQRQSATPGVARSFGTAVVAARTERGLSRNAAAKLAGVSQQALGGIEYGQSDPKLSAALKIARALGLSIDALPTE